MEEIRTAALQQGRGILLGIVLVHVDNVVLMYWVTMKAIWAELWRFLLRWMRFTMSYYILVLVPLGPCLLLSSASGAHCSGTSPVLVYFAGSGWCLQSKKYTKRIIINTTVHYYVIYNE